MLCLTETVWARGRVIMNKRLLVLAAMMSIWSINVMGASVDVGTDTIRVGTQPASQSFEGTTISTNQIMLNENFPDDSNERTIITPGSLDVSNQQRGMRFDGSGLVISDRAAASSLAPDPDPSTVKIYATQVNPTGITVSDGQPNGLMLTYDGEAGIHAGNMQMHDVAAGVADTDAVNVSQLRDATSQISNVMINVDHKINKAGAATAALSGLHYLDYNPNDKWSFATSVGHYKNTMVHLGVALGSESTFNLGASFKLGYQDPSLKMSRFEMAQQIKDLQADNADLRAEIKEIKMALQKLH